MNQSLPTLCLSFFLLLILPGFAMAEELDLPPSGSDVSSMRCPNGVVAIGDNVADVLKKCGDPLRTGWMAGRTYDIGVYHFKGSRFIYYLGTRKKRVERIYSVNCQKGDPLCQ